MFSATAKDEPLYKGEKNITANGGVVTTEAHNDLREVAHDAGRRAKRYLNTARDSMTHTTENVTAEIRRNPVQSSLIALGIGFLVGGLFRRS